MKFQRVFRDANHLEIVKELKRRGYAVVDLAAVGQNVPDIIVADATVTALVEIKLPTGWFSLGQLEFMANWPGIGGFAENVQDVEKLMVAPNVHRLSQSDKDAILAICAELRADELRDQRQPRIKVTKFTKLFEQMRDRY